MNAIGILLDKSTGRPVDRVEAAINPKNMPWEVAGQFALWLCEQMPAGAKSTIDREGRYFTTIAREYVFDATNAAAAEVYSVAYSKVRMLALLYIEAVGFGKAGRNARRAHARELLRLCRKHVEDNKPVKTQMTALYNVLGAR